MSKRFLSIGVAGLGLSAALLIGQSGSQVAATTQPSTAAARLAAAERVCEMLHDAEVGTPTGHLDVEHAYLWSVRRMESQLAVDEAQGDRISAVDTHARRMRELAARVGKLYKEDVATGFQLESTRYYVAEADDMLEQARAK